VAGAPPGRPPAPLWTSSRNQAFLQPASADRGKRLQESSPRFCRRGESLGVTGQAERAGLARIRVPWVGGGVDPQETRGTPVGFPPASERRLATAWAMRPSHRRPLPTSRSGGAACAVEIFYCLPMARSNTIQLLVAQSSEPPEQQPVMRAAAAKPWFMAAENPQARLICGCQAKRASLIGKALMRTARCLLAPPRPVDETARSKPVNVLRRKRVEQAGGNNR